MAPLFEFKAGRTLLHTLDPRSKLIIICLLCASLASASWPACILLLVPLLLILDRLGTDPLTLIKNLKYFILFLGIIVLARGLAISGTPLFSVFGLPFSVLGTIQGSLVALRFFTVMVLGLIFSATTSPSHLKAAAQWFLKPLPYIPEKRAGMVIGLALRFLPLIFSQSRETGQAIAARCGHSRKNPVKRIGVHALSLLSRSFGQADRLSLAMEARCYTENRTDPTFQTSGREPPAITLSAAYTILTSFF